MKKNHMKRHDEKTDWTSYYSKKKSFFSTFTQKYTLDNIGNSIASINDKNISVLECGGGNSCFAKQLCSRFPNIIQYDIVDNNSLAVDLFNKFDLDIPHVGKCIDLINNESISREAQYDFVFSIGLIEHFSESDREKVINAHFDLCKPGGIVFISFPTPTLKYRICRSFMELIHVWQFWDETPLRKEAVSVYMEKRGKIILGFLNKKLPLSQYILVAKNN